MRYFALISGNVTAGLAVVSFKNGLYFLTGAFAFTSLCFWGAEMIDYAVREFKRKETK